MKMKQIILVFLSFMFLQALNAQSLLPANNASDVSVDMQFKLTFSSTPFLQSSGNVRLYESNGTLVSTINLSQMPTGTPMSASWPWQETLNRSTINVFRAVVDGNTCVFSFPINSMSYGKSYYVTVDQNVFSNASALGFSGISANQWRFSVKASQPATDNEYIVDANGTGDFATLQGALNYLPSGNSNAHIFIKNGTYVGYAFMRDKSGYTIEGESREGVIIKGFNNSNINASTHWRSVVNLDGNDIHIISLTMINTTPSGGSQAEALKLNGDRCIIVNCDFYSYQDTLLIEGKVYFQDCMIEGDVDFVWGRGTVFFQSCEIRANDNGGYNVMARNDNTLHGYAFADCFISRKSSATTRHYLGRDANTGYPYAEIVYLNCTMSDHIDPSGWLIRNEMDASKLFFAEYRSVNESGNLINTSNRHSKSRQLSTSQANQYRDLNWFFNGWVPDVPDYTASNLDCNGDINGGATLDECGVCVGGNTNKVSSCLGSIQGEDFCDAIGVFEDKNTGFSGTGYINFDNQIGSNGKWYVNAETAGSKTLGFRYANGGGAARSMTISVNGSQSGTFQANPTSSWTVWNTEMITLNLSKGVNEIVLTATTADGGPNLDLLSFESEGLLAGGCDADCYGTIGGAAYVDNCNTCVSGNTGLEACKQDCEGNWGGTAYLDDCSVCVEGNTGRTPCLGALEGETACQFDGIQSESDNKGFSGEGYVNTTNVVGSYASWVINSDAAKSVTLGFRYANGGATSRDGSITVNGMPAGNLILPSTGDWENWDLTTINLDLEQGSSDIVVTATTADGLANIDLIAFYAEGVTDAQCGLITSVHEYENAGLYVYPNPTSSTINWGIEADWILMTTNGVELQQGRGKETDVSDYPSGLYLLQIEGKMIKVMRN